MSQFSLTKLLVVLAMLLSIAGGPALALANRCPGTGKVGIATSACCNMPCCAGKMKQPAQEQRAPIGQRGGQELSEAVTAAPFAVLYTIAPADVKRPPIALFADGHAPEPLAASCIQLI